LILRRYDLPKLGYLIYQMLTGNILKLDSYNAIGNKEIDPSNLLNELLLSNVSDELTKFFKEMTFGEKKFSTSQISLQATLDIKNDPCFSDIEWDKLENGAIQSPLILDRVKF